MSIISDMERTRRRLVDKRQEVKQLADECRYKALVGDGLEIDFDANEYDNDGYQCVRLGYKKQVVYIPIKCLQGLITELRMLVVDREKVTAAAMSYADTTLRGIASMEEAAVRAFCAGAKYDGDN